MEYSLLSEIASVQSGLVLSRKEASVSSDNILRYKQLNLRAISEDNAIIIEELDEYRSNEAIGERYITKDNDIILRIFPPLYPTLIKAASSKLIIPSQFAVIRTKSNRILPDFLRCYLSRRDIAERLSATESFQGVRSIRISDLANLQIPIPPIEKQKLLISYEGEYRTQKKLKMQLLHQYDIRYEAIMNKVIGKETL